MKLGDLTIPKYKFLEITEASKEREWYSKSAIDGVCGMGILRSYESSPFVSPFEALVTGGQVLRKTFTFDVTGDKDPTSGELLIGGSDPKYKDQMGYIKLATQNK